MAMGWIGSFKNIPWTKVLSVAPSVVDGAKKLWGSVTTKNALIQKPLIPPEVKAYSPDPAISAIEAQMHALELRNAQIGEEIVLSSEVIDKLAEQQSQLVQAVDILRVRTRGLLWICGVLVAAIMLLLYLVAAR